MDEDKPWIDLPQRFDIELEDELQAKITAGLIERLTERSVPEVVEYVKVGQVVAMMRDELREGFYGKGRIFSAGDFKNPQGKKVLRDFIDKIYEIALTEEEELPEEG